MDDSPSRPWEPCMRCQKSVTLKAGSRLVGEEAASYTQPDSRPRHQEVTPASSPRLTYTIPHACNAWSAQHEHTPNALRLRFAQQRKIVEAIGVILRPWSVALLADALIPRELHFR
jgi:hypothetical protein